MSSFRDDGIYVPYKTRKALQLIAVAKAHDEQGNTITADGLATSIIDEWLLQNHKDVVDWLQSQSDAAKAFAKAQAEKLGLKYPLS